MNASPRQREIERLERWLRRFPTPGPSPQTLDAVKTSVRRACADRRDGALRMTAAVAHTKSVVRSVLSANRAAPRRVPFARLRSSLATAAAVAFGVVFWRALPPAQSSDAGALTRFVSVMSRAPDEFERTLDDLVADLRYLENAERTIQNVARHGVLTDSIGPSLDALAEEVLRSEKPL